MRFAIIVLAAAALLLPATRPAKACYEAIEAFAHEMASDLVAAKQAASADLSAKSKAIKKKHRKHKKKKKEKVEYMRAVPWK